MTLREKIDHLVEDLAVIENRQERLAAVVDRARRTPGLRDEERVDSNRVPGCISSVWVVGELRTGRCHFRCDADGPLVKGLVAFLCEAYDGAPPEEIAADQLDPLGALGLRQDLTPTRQNGLGAVLNWIRAFAKSAAQPN